MTKMSWQKNHNLFRSCFSKQKFRQIF